MDLSPDQMRRFLGEAIAEARAGEAEGEVPIGSVIVVGAGDRARIVARGHNSSNRLRRRTAHAEIVAFERTDGLIADDEEEVALISTLEPCVMCFGAAIEAGVALVVYGLPAPLDAGSGRVKEPSSPESRMPRLVGGVRREECEGLFRDWLARRPAEADDLQSRFVRETLEALGTER